MTTQIIPTDKHGHVYYGPRNFSDACDMIGDTDEATPAHVADMLDRAGYTGIANRIRKEFDVTK